MAKFYTQAPVTEQTPDAVAALLREAGEKAYNAFYDNKLPGDFTLFDDEPKQPKTADMAVYVITVEKLEG